MFGSSNIEVYRHPVIAFFFVGKGFVVMRVYKAEIVPARTGPLRHCIGFPFCFLSAFGAFCIYPRVNSRQGAFARTCGSIAFYLGQG